MRLLTQAIQFSTPHHDCKYKFNAVTVTWHRDYKIPCAQRLSAIAFEARKANLSVRLVKADMVERNILCNKKSHLSQYGCDQCVARTVGGHYICETTFHEPMRDELSWKREVEEGYTFLGRKGPSPLHDLPNFEICEGLPVDPMHQVFLGHVHFLLKRFILSDQCHEGFKVKDELLKDMNEMYMRLQIPDEINRSPREYDKAWCANEFKVFLLTCGHLLADILEAYGLHEVAYIFGRFTYFTRALLMPCQWLEDVEGDVDLQDLIHEHLRDLERLLGEGAMNANGHALTHLVHWRSKYRLHTLSCEPGEAFFGQNKRSLEVRNKHYGRQVHHNRNTMYLKGHECTDTFSVSNPTTNSKKSNAVIVDNEMKVYRYADANYICIAFVLLMSSFYYCRYQGEASGPFSETLTCKRFILGEYKPSHYQANWSKVGVFVIRGMQQGGLGPFVNKNNISGKGVINGNNLKVYTRDMWLV